MADEDVPFVPAVAVVRPPLPLPCPGFLDFDEFGGFRVVHPQPPSREDALGAVRADNVNLSVALGAS